MKKRAVFIILIIIISIVIISFSLKLTGKFTAPPPYVPRFCRKTITICPTAFIPCFNITIPVSEGTVRAKWCDGRKMMHEICKSGQWTTETLKECGPCKKCKIIDNELYCSHEYLPERGWGIPCGDDCCSSIVENCINGKCEPKCPDGCYQVSAPSEGDIPGIVAGLTGNLPKNCGFNKEIGYSEQLGLYVRICYFWRW